MIFARRRIGIGTGLVFLALYVLYLLGLYNNWSFEGIGNLIIEPSAQSPT